MKISVVMPAFNAESYIRESIESILSQSYPDFEFIIIDDNSTDKTPEIIREYASKDKRIKVITNETTQRVAKALNIGLRASTGEYIVRMDADDISLPHRFETQVKFMDKNPEIGVAGSWYEMFGDLTGVRELPTDPDYIKAYMLLHGAVAHPAVIFRRQLFEDNSLSYNENFTYGQDYDLWVRASKITKITNIPEVLLKYRIHTKNVGSVHSAEQNNSVRAVHKIQLMDLGIYPTFNEIEMHQALSNWSYSKNIKFTFDTIEWIKKIVAFNHEKRIYHEKSLIDFLLSELINIYSGADHLNDKIESGIKKEIQKFKASDSNTLAAKLHSEIYKEDIFFDSDNPMISVVMPAYNSEKYIADTIESILNQTYKNFEFLIINDNSTDSTEEIVRRYAAKDERIRLINNKLEKGIVGGLNTGIVESKGKYIARMDSDDIAYLNRFEKQLEYLEANQDVGMCGTWYRMFGQYEKIQVLPTDHDTLKVTILFYGPFAHPTVMIRKSVLTENNLRYSNEYIWVEDIELWVRMSKVTKLANIPEILLNYRTHGESVGSTKKDIQAEKVAKLHLQELGDLGLVPSDYELLIHEKVGYGDFSDDIVFFWNVKDWFSKIITHNKEQKIYSQNTLINFLTNKLIDLYKFSGYRSLRRVFMILKFFIFKRDLSFKSRLRLLIRLSYLSFKLQIHAIFKKDKKNII